MGIKKEVKEYPVRALVARAYGMHFVNYVNDYSKQGYELEKSVDMTVERCIKEDVLKHFLMKHRAEVIEVILEES